MRVDRLDSGAADAAIVADPEMATVGELDRTETAEGRARVSQNAYKGAMREVLVADRRR
jgi:hypothetical protein